MKTKPILLIAVSVIVLATSSFLFFRGKKIEAPQKSEIILFLGKFKAQLSPTGSRDTLLTYIANRQENEPLNDLLYLLMGIPRYDYDVVPFHTELNINQSNITFTNPELAVAIVPVTFSGDQLKTKTSAITFTIQKIADHQYKIYMLDVRNFMKDFLAYKNHASQKNYSDKDIYSPATLKAFTDASNLYARYDSVVWFSHIKDQTYFYVIKGKWNLYEALEREKDPTKTYKMGLVSPDYKELIPAEYDLVHNISGTFPNLIEVEKEHKRGFYDLNGKIVIPVEYDQVFPVNDTENLAALKKGNDYFWLRNDYTVSEKADIAISDLFSKLKQPASFTLTKSPNDDITEFNSHDHHGSIYLPPSYLVDLGLTPQVKEFKNPLRNHVDFVESSSQYEVKAQPLPAVTTSTDNNWLQSAFYSIRDYFIGGRSEFYDTNNIVLIDKKNNAMYGYSVNTDVSGEEGPELSGKCNEFNIRPITDSLLEVKITSTAALELYDKTYLDELPAYHYLKIQNGKIHELKTTRLFAFTKFQQMDDQFINGCYVYGSIGGGNQYKTRQSLTLSAEVLKYMKNEIYADYDYRFKDPRWTKLFTERNFEIYKGKNTSVQDSLTEIDKYNIQWIDQKLKTPPAKVLAAK